ncbi:hypothetical protein N752_01800 [Desulforamulus aquiferis]|nr:PRC-barrel domain-containing protein [Desulforamulus aquiferis]RYD06887.1 hypothetical protein N752_01800 [Desulforamulus aquiferis]
MKQRSQVIGLPVLSIIEVAFLGKVQNLLINPDSGTVEYLVIEPEQWYLERQAISFKDVAAIGEDAVTTEVKANVATITSVSKAMDLLQKSVTVVGTRVMTRKGRISGSIDEIIIDEQTGKIAACSWVAGDKKGLIPVDQVITFGKDMLVIEDNFESNLLQDISQLESNSSAKAVKSESETDPLEYFEKQQKQYLIGRIVTTDILAANGEMIAKKGDVVTENWWTRLRLQINLWN